jgi:hypothetical protein
MPVYLDEDMVGTDPDLVGFPHLLVCMGVLCMTERNLYGVHLGEIEYTNAGIDSFKVWLGVLGVGGADLRGLYGSANFGIRYRNISGKGSDLTQLWRVEMNRIAARLGYRGPIYGFDTSVIAPEDGTYVEYRSQWPRPTSRIFYKRNQKMEYTTQQMDGGGPNVAKINIDTLALQKEIFVKTSAVVVAKSTLNELDYSTRLISYVSV